jgi:aspartyl-tRNA(Asn)/glutamyl-tRNA(Gln) amidotransferase subunit C
VRLDDAGLDHLARLARLRLTPEERARLREDLERILEYVAILDAVDPGDHPAPLEAVGGDSLRPDEVHPPLTNEAALAAAPEALDGHFAVPAVVRRELKAEENGT